MGSHQKHTPLVKPDCGNFGRNEIAIMGTPCANIRKLSYQLIEVLKKDYNIAYIDADHKHSDEGENIKLEGALNSGASIDFTDKISFQQINKKRTENQLQVRKSFSDQDLIIVNGNHFTASRQILVIDPKKDLQKKSERITDVLMILLNDSQLEIPDFLKTQLRNFNDIPVFTIKDVNHISSIIRKKVLENTPEIKGLVLAGGKSERMQQDKGLINYHGLPQREYVAGLLSKFCSEVYISCRPDQVDSIKSNFNPLPDTFSGLGPFGGITSAFRHDPNAAWLAIACDLPYLGEDTLDFLISKRNPSKIATSFWDSDHKFPEPLVTIWEPKAYTEMLYFLSQGYSCPRKVLINSDIELIEAPDIHSLTNVNNPEEMKLALDQVQHEK